MKSEHKENVKLIKGKLGLKLCETGSVLNYLIYTCVLF